MTSGIRVLEDLPTSACAVTIEGNGECILLVGDFRVHQRIDRDFVSTLFAAFSFFLFLLLIFLLELQLPTANCNCFALTDWSHWLTVVTNHDDDD